MFKKIALLLVLSVGVWAAHAPVIYKSTGGLRSPTPANWNIVQMIQADVSEKDIDTTISLSTPTWGYNFINTCPLRIKRADPDDSIWVYIDIQGSANDTDWTTLTTISKTYLVANNDTSTTDYYEVVNTNTNNIPLITQYMRAVKRVDYKTILNDSSAVTVDLDLMFRE